MATDNVIYMIFEGTKGSGLYDYVLPFLLVFALVYALLDEINTIKNNGSQAIISGVVAFFVIYSGVLSVFMKLFAGPLALWLVLILAIMIAAQLVGLWPEGDSRFKTGVGVVAVGGVAALILLEGGFGTVYCSGPSATGMADVLCGGFNAGGVGISADLPTLLIVVFGVGVMAWIVSED